jgi:hypothetical protein
MFRLVGLNEPRRRPRRGDRHALGAWKNYEIAKREEQPTAITLSSLAEAKDEARISRKLRGLWRT